MIRVTPLNFRWKVSPWELNVWKSFYFCSCWPRGTIGLTIERGQSWLWGFYVCRNMSLLVWKFRASYRHCWSYSTKRHFWSAILWVPSFPKRFPGNPDPYLSQRYPSIYINELSRFILLSFLEYLKLRYLIDYLITISFIQIIVSSW